ncbi:phosphatase PAP2 family protein [Halorhodospira halophila]|uniref:phosphatase PAP2 family protein n=1 Tax=Halorhodospira halophila TaxID=1053 RepID=UPI0019032060|nr:phosphatase PAP2 family protein [Halorhodospira halophila]MBK1728826.1 hypothetical protein [Halorhodospira halophila]
MQHTYRRLLAGSLGIAVLVGLSGAPAPTHAASGDTPGQAESAPGEYTYWGNFLRIPARAAGELVRTDPEGLRRNAIAVGSIAAAFALDQQIRDTMQDDLRGRDSDELTDILYEVGRPKVALAGFVGGYAYSFLARDRYFRETLHLSFQSLLITQVITDTTRNVGRERPRNSPDDAFNFGNRGGQSYFSGHASGTWAVMTVLASRYPHAPVQWGAYGLATAVSLSRVHDDGHWTSDIVTGSGVRIKTWTTRWE